MLDPAKAPVSMYKGVASCVGSHWVYIHHNFTEDLLPDISILFVPVSIMNHFTWLIFVLSVKMCFCMLQTGICRPICTGSDCITLNKDRVDFNAAEGACHHRNGELVTFQPEMETNILDILSQELNGDFWIGLRLPAGACSNLSAPLRGYEWTSSHVQTGFTPSSSTWKDSVKVCSPRCVSLSLDGKWVERLCSDKTEGYLCRTTHKHACQAQELSESHVFQSSEGCKPGPCQHDCTDVKGGYKCSCFKGYIPDSRDPRQCKLHCSQKRCPVICDNPNQCFCPDGFLNSDTICEDIDECSMDSCDQDCKNTFGSFVCSCAEGFVLKNEVRCIKSAPSAKGTVQPAANNNTLKASSATAGSFLWIWICVVVAVIVFIFVLRLYVVKRQKQREQNSNQQPAVPADNIEC
ncbi:complement component C1q receptor-like [Antennarius striatus]|uniref:complement component C1q receptor-like n=1 Tax=Antennarius striatus TaxID=241820 RepID=UPI0035B35C00